MPESLNEALQAIDEQIKDDEVVTPDEIEEYLDKNPDSEVAKKAKKSLENLNNEISVKVETLKQRIIFDSVQLKEGFSDKKELMWSNAMKVWVNPVAFAMLLNGETNWDTKAWSKTWAVWLGQFTQWAIDEVNSSGVLWFNNLDKKWLLNLSENQQIYLSAWFLKEKYNRVSKNWWDWSDAVVAYNIWEWFYWEWKISEKKVDRLVWWQAYGKKFNNTAFNEEMLKNVPDEMKELYSENPDDNSIQKRIIAINLAKDYYFKNNPNFKDIFNYSPIWTETVVKSDWHINNDIIWIMAEWLNIDQDTLRQVDVWWIWQLSITDVVWFAYWWLNIFWAVLEWMSWNTSWAIEKALIAYVGIKNMSKELKWNVEDFEKWRFNSIERIFWNDVSESDKKRYVKILEKVQDREQNWNQEYFKAFSDTKNWEVQPLSVVKFINEKVDFEKIKMFGEITEENVDWVLKDWEFGALKWTEEWKRILLGLNLIKADWIKNKKELAMATDYLIFLHTNNWFDKIRKLIA